MIKMYTQKKTLTEGKYGYKFDQFKAPFKNEGKFIVDSNGKQLGEFKNADLAKEMASILSDLPKIRDAADRLATIWR